jgi:phage shock protein C
MSVRRTKFYLDKRNKKFLGVCAGVADFFGIDPIWIRLATALGTMFLGWPLLAYLIIAWAADAKPYALYEDDADTQAFWRKARVAPQRTIRDVRSSFRDIDRRMRDIEAHVTSSNSRLAAEIDSLR